MTEYLEQCKFVQYLTLLKNQGKIIEFWAVSNENNTYKQDKRYAMINEVKLKKSGKKSGVCDISILLMDKLVMIEMKKQKKLLKNGSLSSAGISVSENQIKFIETVNKSNICFSEICFGFESAKKYIDSFI